MVDTTNMGEVQKPIDPLPVPPCCQFKHALSFVRWLPFNPCAGILIKKHSCRFRFSEMTDILWYKVDALLFPF